MKCVVSLSAGLDSTFNLYEAYRSDEISLVLTFNYGQKSAKQEILKSQFFCQKLNLPHKVIDLSFLSDFKTSLTSKLKKVPEKNEVSIRDLKVSQKTKEAVWVPNRNGVFFNVAASFAEYLKADCVVGGFNKEEAKTFPDNSHEFAKALDQSFFYSTQNHVTFKSFSMNQTKKEIFEKALELNIDIFNLWPCYLGGDDICEHCESCQRFLEAGFKNFLKESKRKKEV